MENAADALILAFAVMIFTMALSLSMSIFSQARQTSDMVIGTVESKRLTEYEGVNLNSLEYRKVGLETIIPTLYRYYKENLTVVFVQGTLNADGTISNVQPLTIYNSYVPPNEWEISYKGGNMDDGTVVYPSYGYKLNNTISGNICVFDIDEESARHEPFISDRKGNIDKILDGYHRIGTASSSDYDYYNRGYYFYNYQGNVLTNRNYQYLELISRESKEALGGNKTTRKTIITYMKIN